MEQKAKEKLISELEDVILLLKGDTIDIGMISSHGEATKYVRESKWKKIEIQYKLK